MARILIVDDDQPVRALMRAILSLGGHTVAEASDGTSALDAIDGEPFDLVLLDLMLPGLSGYEVLERAASHGHHDLKVIVVSALDDSEGRGLREASLGALDHITKPFGSREIEDAVALALDANASDRRRGRENAAAIYRATFEMSERIRSA